MIHRKPDLSDRPHSLTTLLKLTHAGFADKDSRDGHEEALPLVLEQLEQRMNLNLISDHKPGE